MNIVSVKYISETLQNEMCYTLPYFIRFAVKGRECSTHDDCSAIDRTSCVKDSNDYKLRCLCGDDSPPMNGLCPDVLKGGWQNPETM